MALIRPALLAGLVYLGYVVAFPDYEGTAYHVFALALIAGGAVGVWFLKKILDLGEGTVKILIEIIFVLGVVVIVGYTMPQKSHHAPLEQWAAGMRPTQSDARRGLTRIGIDPDGTIASRMTGFFPRR